MEAFVETWVLITVAAAFLQNVRSSLQKHLKGVMGTAGATFVRFGFGLPVALVFVWLIHRAGGYPLPTLNAGFAFWVVVAALSQIAAQALLIYLFSFRNFVVGSAYSRTEPVQAAIFGLVFLGERASLGLVAAIVVAMVGVMLISVARTAFSPASLVTSLFSRTAAIGLASGAFFGLAAVGYRAASLALGGPAWFMQAGFTLAVAITFQTLIMGLWMAWRDRGEFARIAAAWKISAIVGLVGASASFGWFAAMTLQQAAAVKTVAQVEFIFTIATSVFFFRERLTPAEIAGVAFIVAGIIALLWAG